ncbi:hypothetical protein [Bremerella cremea]|uniref:hypothetical protein n=1 Tax=Bremerella cremea TaxID=1031537 RepID=UPI0031EB5DC2
MGIALKSRKESFDFYESFSDLLFNTLVLFLVLIVGLILLVNSEITRVQKKDEDVEKRLADAKKITEKLRLEEAALNVRKERLQTQNDQLTQQQQNIQQEIKRQTEQFQRDAVEAQAQAEQARRQAERQVEQSKKQAEQTVKSAEQRVEKAREALASFVGMKGKLKNIVVLLDLSGSMTMSEGADARFERVKEEISGLIEHLEPETFNVIGFGGQGTSGGDPRFEKVSSGLVRWTPNACSEAQARISAWEVGGGTPTLRALGGAFDCSGVDTILLYTDGSPTIPNCSQQAVLDYVATRNRSGDVVINCVGIGAYDNSGVGIQVDEPCKSQITMTFVEFLRKMAVDNGGSFSAR